MLFQKLRKVDAAGKRKFQVARCRLGAPQLTVASRATSGALSGNFELRSRPSNRDNPTSFPSALQPTELEHLNPDTMGRRPGRAAAKNAAAALSKCARSAAHGALKLPVANIPCLRKHPAKLR